MKILVATGNRHKKEELNNILVDHELIMPEDLGIKMDVEETGSTYLENALLKAQALFRESNGIAVLSDDSGISVKALNGEPGIHSARYGLKELGKELSTEEKNKFLLKNMEHIEDRTAEFVCCMVLILEDNRVFTAQETFKGHLTTEPYGKGGFGYDPIFFTPELNKTAAELTDDEKNRVSHRGKAGKRINKILEDL